ncbi:UPF0182 family protein [Patescibacteria group bacterium]
MKNFKIKYVKFALFVLFILIFLILPWIVRLFTDWLWFQETGFQIVFLTIIKSRIAIGIAATFITFLLLWLNLILFRKLTKKEPIIISLNKGEYVQQLDITSIFNKVALPAILIFSALIGTVVSAEWQTVLQYLNRTSFGTLDPILSRDISFYIFSLPFYQLVINTLSLVLFVSFIAALVLYLGKGALIFKNRKSLENMGLGKGLITISKDAKTHLIILIAAWFAITAAKIYYLRMPGLLFSSTDLIFGASFTDIHATLPFLKILLAVSIIGIILALLNIRKNGFKLIISAFLLYIAVAFIGGVIYPVILQNFIVKPNELVKETPYIEYHIEATQTAWGLDKIGKRDLAGESSLTIKDVQESEATIKNIRLWDRGPLLDTFGQLQEIRTYYDFISVDNDRYMLDGEYRQVLLSPRELNSKSLPQKNFINERLTFTHGMGLTLSPVNEVTEEGLPVLFVKDLPPQSIMDTIEITQPEIYFGELSNDYAIVNTKAKEFDYPSGTENVFSNYAGSGGVSIKSLIRKAIFAIRFQSTKILLSNDVTSESRVLYYRDITERVQKALPFLELDNDPYLVIHEGKLSWIYDGYTTSNKYPYSIRVDGDKNYMRNSVKVVIDAYNGTIKAYIADENDPMIQTFAKIFPGIFEPLEAMPEELKKHIRYPEDIFAYQTSLYTTYHMELPQIFYNKEDQWEIPVIKGSTRGENLGPVMRHLIMKLPDEEQEEFILMLPFTPRQKNNMSAWMVARSDGDHYGELIVYHFPKQSLVFGPTQIVNRINQDAEISQQISLWDQRGSEVIQGNLFVIPIKESILYVRPLYIRAEGGKIPELKRVIVAYENQIAMEQTLDMALSRIFGSGAVTQSQKPTQPTPVSQNELLRQAKEHFNRAQSALRQGNWTLYGEEMRKLQDTLNSL